MRYISEDITWIYECITQGSHLGWVIKIWNSCLYVLFKAMGLDEIIQGVTPGVFQSLRVRWHKAEREGMFYHA